MNIDYKRRDLHRYDDMLRVPHHVSVRHPHMPLSSRAAQFLPYKSLTGFEEKIKETQDDFPG